MEVPNLDRLTDIGLRGGVDMRPTLLRVLTDLYVHRLKHTPDEERHYAELALRLLESVDVPTRAAVAARLARHLSPPLRVIHYLANDLPEVAAPLQSHPLLRANPQTNEHAPGHVAARIVQDKRPTAPSDRSPAKSDFGNTALMIDSKIADELNEMFFAASTTERRLILLNLHVVAPIPSGRVAISRDPAVGQQLEAAALGRNREDFVQQLAPALRIPHEHARRVVRDNLGEPIAVAAKAIGTPRSVYYRILLFLNPAVGLSVNRVHALAAFYDELTAQAAEGMVAIWQALPKHEHATAPHQPLLHDDPARQRGRPTVATVKRMPVAVRSSQRSEAS